MKARRIGIGLLLATANIVRYMPVLPISKELSVKDNIEKATKSAMTRSTDIRGG
jgi:hypothetical protein